MSQLTSPVPVISEPQSPPIIKTAASSRSMAVDAYRGLVMFLMMGEVLELAKTAAFYPGNALWQIAAYNQTHVEWAGLALHDMIQPSFSFLVGVAVPFSIASRIKQGQSFSRMLTHTIIRSVILMCLGFFLRSQQSAQTNFTFEDTLTQIGMGYTFLFLLGFRSAKWQWGALGAILAGYWLAWALYPAPGANFDWNAMGVPANWPHNFTGFASHWNKNSNLGTAIDQWFLNLFPREKPWVYNGGGYLTSSFIPTLGTMILGLIAGGWIKASAPLVPFKKFLLTGVACFALAVVLHYTGICPIVKRIWTPSWTLFSGGICFFSLSAFSWLVDVKGYRKAVFPLTVVGRNSITAYFLSDMCGSYVSRALYIHLGHGTFQMFGQSLGLFLHGVAMLLIFWLILYWMYKRNIFIRI